METKSRTLKQNNALHLWCRELATELNERGLTFKKVVKDSFDLDWNEDMVKRVFWQSFAKVKFGTEHTSELTTSQLQDIYEEINRVLSAPKFDGIHMPFPSSDNIPQYDPEFTKAYNEF
jgi:hypothetical protein